MEGLVEILRRIGAIAHGAVVDQRLGMNNAVLEGQAIDEGLEGRARRTERLRQVHLSGAPGVEIARAADMGQDLAAFIVRHDHGHRGTRAHRMGALARQRLERSLQIAGQRGRLHRSIGRLAGQALCHVGGKHGKGLTRPGCRFEPRGCGLVRIDGAVAGKPGDHPVARLDRRVRPAVGPPRLGRLGNGNEECGFGGRQPLGLLAEIGQRGGP